MTRYTFGTMTRWVIVLLVALGLIASQTVGAATPPSKKASAQKTPIVINGEAANNRFGDALAVSGDGSTIIVGADAVNSNAGAAYLLTKQADGTYAKRILGTGTSGSSDAFGSSVAMSRNGATIVVGADAVNGAGEAYVFTRQASGDFSRQVLQPDGDRSGLFGVSVAVSDDGNTVAVGSPYGSASQGTAYAFLRQDNDFARQALGTGTAENDNFGMSVAVSGDGSVIVVGADGVKTGTGAAYLFTRQDNGYGKQQTLGTGSGENSKFGISLAVNGDGSTIIIGAPFDNDAKGAAYLFTRKQDGSYAMQQLAMGAEGADDLGTSVAINADGSAIIIGGTGANGDNGGAYLFTRQGDGTYAMQDLGAGVSGDDRYGSSVGVSNDRGTVAIGATNVSNNTGTVTIIQPAA